MKPLSSRVLDVLRGAAARVPAVAPRAPRGTLDDALLFSQHDIATKAAESAMSTCQAAGATAAQQRSALDAAADHARLLGARGRDLRGAAQQVRDALDRAKLVALNAGLEGSRLAEPAGKAMLAIAEEMRALVTRALESLDEHLALLGQIERERDKLGEQVEHSRQRAAALAEELLRAQAAQREARAALTELGQKLQLTTGTDPQSAQAAAKAAEHARGLLDALSALSTQSQRGFVWRALGPTVQPLLRLLRELDKGGAGGGPE